MIDAATIGITLALNDGVSEGIARIRQDLAGLDAAVSVASLRLTQLSSLATGAGRAVAVGIATGTPSAPERPSAEPEPYAAALFPPTPAAAAPIPSPADRGDRVPQPVEQRDAAMAPAAAFQESRDFASFGRAIATEPHERARPHLPAPEAPGPVALAIKLPREGPESPASLAPVDEGSGPTTHVRGRNPVAPIPSSLPPAPAAVSVTGGHDPRPRNAGEDEGQPQPMAVEITLDGNVLARWLSAELGQQATRPPAGAGAFDPRLSPTWFAA